MKRRTKKPDFNWTSLDFSLLVAIVFIWQVYFNLDTDSWKLVSSDVFSRPWILFTSALVHANYMHFYSNIIGLAFFGLVVERIVGHKNYLLAISLFMLFGGAISAMAYPSSLGASGIVFGLMGIVLVLRPFSNIYAFGLPMPTIVVVPLYAILNLLGVFYGTYNIGYADHIAGLLMGILLGLHWRPRYKEKKRKEKGRKLTDKEFQEWEERYMKQYPFKMKGGWIVFDEDEGEDEGEEEYEEYYKEDD